MKLIRTVEAAGHVLCHDLTQIVPGVSKDARFRKGHIVAEDDIPVLLSMGKEHLYVWESNESMLHENEAAERLVKLCRNIGMEPTAVKEGKIELVAQHDGVFRADAGRIDAINDLEDMCIATLPDYMPVKKGTKLAGMRVIPLVIKKERIEEAELIAGDIPLLELLPYRRIKTGVITTGNEVAKGLIKDGFTPVIEAKLRQYGIDVNEHRVSGDDADTTAQFIKELAAAGMDLIICTGGMSVDPDDRTPLAIKKSGADIVTYGAPVLPGAMFLISYLAYAGREITVLGLPGCVMYARTTIFDIMLPRIIAGKRISRQDVRHLGVGGLCQGCEICHYPLCCFGKD